MRFFYTYTPCMPRCKKSNTCIHLITQQQGLCVSVEGILLTCPCGNPLTGRTVKIKIGRKIMTTTTDNNGKFSYSYTAEKVGTFSVNASFAGNEYYNSCTKTGSITINKLTTTLTVSSISLKYGKAATLTGKLVDENSAAISNATLTVRVNSNESETVTTGTDGTYSYTYTPSAVGTDTVTVDYSGGVIYEASSTATGKVTVTRLETKLTVNDITSTKYSHSGVISGTIEDENNNAISSASIKAVLTSTSGTSTTTLTGTSTTDGSFTITIPGTYDVGTYSVTVSYAQSSTGEAATVTKTYEVQKLDTSITLDPISAVKVGKTTIITGNLVDEDGKAVDGETVTVTVNDA